MGKMNTLGSSEGTNMECDVSGHLTSAFGQNQEI